MNVIESDCTERLRQFERHKIDYVEKPCWADQCILGNVSTMKKLQRGDSEGYETTQ